MTDYNNLDIAYAQRQRLAAINRPVTLLSLAQTETNRPIAVEAAESIIDQFPQVHFILLTAFESWGAWEVKIFDLFDENRDSLPNQERICSFIVNEVLDYSETIMPFEIHSGEMLDLRKLISDF